MHHQRRPQESNKDVILKDSFNEKEWLMRSYQNEHRRTGNAHHKTSDVVSDQQPIEEVVVPPRKHSSEIIALSSALRAQDKCAHEIHPHPHRRHYPHHLLDHFSGDLTHQRSASATWKDIIEGGQLCPSETQIQVEQSESSGLHSSGALPSREQGQAPLEKPVTKQRSKKIISDKTYSHLNEPQQWPFFGTESRVLPSGRKVSFLKQACLGFLSTVHDRDQNDAMNALCPKAFRQPSLSGTRISLLRHRSNVADLNQKFSSRKSSEKQPAGQSCVGVQKFRNETGEMTPCTTIIDSSSTKGSHPVPKAPGVRPPVTRKASEKTNLGEMTNYQLQQKGLSRKLQKNLQIKSSSASLTRKFGAEKADSLTSKPSRGLALLVQNPPSLDSKVQEPPESVTARTSRKRLSSAKTKTIVAIAGESKDFHSSSSSESIEDGSSLVLVQDDVTSTYEELSIDISELSDRNFLIDYGDPSRLYFRNQWNARMRNLGEATNSMKDRLKNIYEDQHEVYQGTLNILGEVENVKLEMGELYDYFDHFEREEDTLLQQVQRQLSQANRYCRILHYRLGKAQKEQVDKNRVQELEEELKLSRQVAVSLHWELQAADTKQAKLERENVNLHHQLLAAETSRDALRSQVARLLSDVDQMSLHAPSKVEAADDSECGISTDSASEMKRQVHFMEEKEQFMIERLVDLQKEKDFLNDALNQYKDQYGELASVLPPGANRHTDLKLRLKLAEDQAGLLARKVIELQLENDNMIKLAAEKELMAKEVMKGNPSVSDLQFLEDERESLRLALDEMEIENQKLAAELLRYKQAVHRQLHSTSASADLKPDVGVVVRVPRSNDSVFEQEMPHSRSHKNEDRSSSHHDAISEHVNGDRRKMRPLTLTSPLNPSQNRNHMPLSRTLSDIAMPLSPDTKNQSVQITPTNSSNVQGSKSASVINGSRKSICQKCKRTKKVRMVDAYVETEFERPSKLFLNLKRSAATSTAELATTSSTRCGTTSPVVKNLQSLFQPVLDVATQIREQKSFTRSKATSPIKPQASSPLPLVHSTSSTFRLSRRPHNALLDEMRKQLANVRNIAESMDNVVNVEEIDADLERRGKKLVDAECRKVKESAVQKRKIAKLAKSLQKYIRDIEESVTEKSETSGGAIYDVTAWNLHGNTELLPQTDVSYADTSTSTLSSGYTKAVLSSQTVRSSICRKTLKDLGRRTLEAVVLMVVIYMLLSSLPVTVMIQVFFLLLTFFIL